MYIIYKIVFIPKKTTVYIGCTKQPLKRRMREHARHSDSAVHDLIKQHGKSNFAIVQIDSSNDEDEAFLKEEFWTKFFRQRTTLRNKMNGRRLTKKQREILYQSRIGTHHSEETKEKIRIHFLGKPGHIPSEETREKLRIARLGAKNPFYGKHHTLEHRRKISKPVICETTGEIFQSMMEAGKRYNIKTASNIGKCCMGKLSHYGKTEDGKPLVWKYA